MSKIGMMTVERARKILAHRTCRFVQLKVIFNEDVALYVDTTKPKADEALCRFSPTDEIMADYADSTLTIG